MFLIKTILLLLATSALAFMMINDWKHREVKLSNLLIFGVAINVWSVITIGIDDWLNQLMLNELVMIIYLSTIMVYLMVRKLPWKKLFQSYFGLGDFLFLVFLAPLFTPQLWVGVSLSCFIAAIVFHLMLNRLSKLESIPFITYAGPVVALAMVYITLFSNHGIA